MEIKRRDMYLTGFHEGEKEYFSKEIVYGNQKGIASLLKFQNVSDPTQVHYNFKDATIVDNGYTWVQIALENANFWIKAMYDENNNLIEIYVDVSKQNIFDDMSNPKYDDMFLDIVIPVKGNIYQMDEMDLMKAFRENLLSEYEYKKAKLVAKALVSYFEQNRQQLLDLLTRLKYELEFEKEFSKEDYFDEELKRVA